MGLVESVTTLSHTAHPPTPGPSACDPPRRAMGFQVELGSQLWAQGGLTGRGEGWAVKGLEGPGECFTFYVQIESL